jgi:hypothetical protein
MSEKEIEQQLPTDVNIPLVWHISENTPRHYASHAFVQTGQHEAFLSFFLAQPPILTGTPEENLAKMKQLEGIQADCVAQIIVNPDLIPKLIEILQTTYQQYQALKQKREGE